MVYFILFKYTFNVNIIVYISYYIFDLGQDHCADEKVQPTGSDLFNVGHNGPRPD
jgi:hypothetical protein